MTNSFLDLDYIIALNEKRVNESQDSYAKVLERLPTLVIIYTALAIFIVPLIQRLLLHEIMNLIYSICFLAYVLLFGYSVYYTVRFMIPVKVAYLQAPKMYYTVLRTEYIAQGYNEVQTGNLLKASYIQELEEAIDRNNAVFTRKSSLYYKALIFSLLASLPYLACLGYHLSLKNDSPQKVEVINLK
ncbi:MAG TPA: hypothetical protein VHK91_11500 [Flavisolibacter sp.]|jgi:hypothetical protein|nr:hypothetical protein [Flavisolibacter sp.]